MFSKIPFQKNQHKYEKDAKVYIGNPKKTEGLLSKAIKKADEKRGTLGEAWGNLQLLVDLVKAYTKGEYKNISTSTILTVIGAILYFVSPLDIVPDFLIGLGIIDDAAVIAYTLKKLTTELDDYKSWKKSRNYPIENPLE